MDIEKIKDDYFTKCRIFKDAKKDYFYQVISGLDDQDKAQLKMLLTTKIKEIISLRSNNGNLFQTESTPEPQRQCSHQVLDDFRNAILNSNLKIEANIWECPESFKEIITRMSYDELNKFYWQCLNKQQELISLHSQDDNPMLYKYYNRDLINNIEILMPLLSFDFPYQSRRDVLGGDSFWGRKNGSATNVDSDNLLTTLGFYKNLLIALENDVFCDTQIGFLNESLGWSAQDIETLATFLSTNNPNITEYQNEYIVRTEIVDDMLKSVKRLLKTISIDNNNKFEIYGDTVYKDLFVLQYKTTPNNFANRVNNITDSTKCEIVLFYLPDKTIYSAFQLGRLDRYSENNFHKPYGKSKIDTLAHIHIYSIEDAALNNKFDKDHKEINLAHYDRLRNLPKSATYQEYESYFKMICGMGITRSREQFFGSN